MVLGPIPIGNIEPGELIWLVTRTPALALRDASVKDGLPAFGIHQDTLAAKSWFMFHARISFAMNTKLLLTLDVIEAAVKA